jgi:hypothetical protein
MTAVLLLGPSIINLGAACSTSYVPHKTREFIQVPIFEEFINSKGEKHQDI